MVATTNKRVIFSKVPSGNPIPNEHLTVQESTIDLDQALEEGQIIIKTLDVSIDPLLRGLMREANGPPGVPIYTLGQPIYGYAMCIVIKSNSPKFKEGDIVTGFPIPFQEYSILSGPLLDSIQVSNEPKVTGLPISYYVGVLGMPGITAYSGLLEVGKPKSGETLFVSAASGAVGQLVGQMGKVLGLRVVGSAGADDKVAYLIEELGFDGAFNYKVGSISDNLTKLCRDGIDIYFDNVGGEILETAIKHCNKFGRVVLCGMVSQVNCTTDERYGIRTLFDLILKSIRMEGYLASEYYHLIPEFTKNVTEWLQEGKIKYRESMAYGVEQIPQALTDVMTGKNFGKQIVHIADI